MSARPDDTSEAAWVIMEAGIRALTPARRVERAVSLTILVHAAALAQIRRDYPDEDERLHRLRLAARTIDPATMRAAFGFPGD